MNEQSRVWNVGRTDGFYPTIQDAIDAINADPVPPDSGDARCVVRVWPGNYTPEDTIEVPGYVTIEGAVYSRGFGMQVVNVNCPANGNDLFKAMGPAVGFCGLHIKASTNPTAVAIDGNDQSKINVVDTEFGHFGEPGLFFKQIGSTWSLLRFKDVLIDCAQPGGGTAPYTSAVYLENTSGALRTVDTYVDRCFWDSHPMTGPAHILRVSGCKDVRVAWSELRSASANSRGITLANGSVVRVNHCYLMAAYPLNQTSGTTFDAAGNVQVVIPH